jgi:hypothetical protein
MKNLFLLCILLRCSILNAQTVTEKDLLGEWHLKTIDSPGVIYVDFVKDSAVIAPGRSAEPLVRQMRKLFTGLLNEEIAEIDGRIFFYAGNRYGVTGSNTEDITPYSLANKGDITYLVIGNSQDTIPVSIKNGELRFGQANGKTGALTFETASAEAARRLHQPIPESVLLGTWRALSISVIGFVYYYQTGEVTLPANIMALAKQKGEDIPALKAKFAQSLKSAEFGDVQIVFKPNGIVEWHKGSTDDTVHYRLIKKKGFIYFKRPIGKDMKVDFKDGHFKILRASSIGGPDSEVIFEKIK